MNYTPSTMTTAKTILFPTDFSERANQALAQAIFFAQQLDAKLIIYHAYHRPVVPGGTPEQIAKSLIEFEKHIDLSFEELLRSKESLKDIDYEFIKELGVSVENIINVSKKGVVDLIMLATKGAKGIDELWGTKAARIINEVDIPVLVIPDNATLDSISKVGIVCDYSKETYYNSLDTLLGIMDTMGLNADVVTLNRNDKAMSTEELAYRQLVRKKLEAVPTSFHFTFDGHVDEGIIKYSLDNNIGMVVILPKSYGFIESIFHESLTQQMAYHSPLPLLVLK
ncbi:MAG: universal stress protein [Bacteroidota bacterium]